jgi:tetratricopeptide (TPR) repeat protein
VGAPPPLKNQKFSYGAIKPGVSVKSRTGFQNMKSSFYGILIIFIASAFLLINTIPHNKKPVSEINSEIETKLSQHHFDDAKELVQKYYKKDAQKADHWFQLIENQKIEKYRSQKGRAFFKKGIILTRSGEFSEAAINFHEALKRFERLKDARFTTLTNLNLGLCYRLMGRWQDSLMHLEHALSNSRENQFKKYEAKALQGIGHTYYRQGQFETAFVILDDARYLHSYLNDLRGESLDWLILGAVQQNRDPGQAEICYRKSRTIARQIGDQQLYTKANGMLNRWLKTSHEGYNGKPLELEML